MPDFFLVRADETALLVNVKPAARLADPAVAGALEWPGRLAREHGWDYEVWSGADPVFLANVRFLAGYRRPWLLPAGLADAVLAAFRPGDTLAALAGRTCPGCPAGSVRAAVLRLVWERRLVTDLTAGLTVTACWRPLMDDGMRTRLSAGARVTYDGQGWEVAELAPPGVLLADAAGGLRRVSISHRLAAPGTCTGDFSGAERPADAGLRLAGLGGGELAQLRERVAHVREACTGYRSGSPDLALPGEPRPEYAPGAGRLQRYQAKAAEMQVGVRTVERWAARLGRDGPAGLVDERHLRRQAPQGGADARWLAMARTVLAEHTEASTPTQVSDGKPGRPLPGEEPGGGPGDFYADAMETV